MRLLDQLYKTMFKRPPIEEVTTDMLENARYELLEHRAAAEYHLAMVALYEQRIARLERPGRVVELQPHTHTGRPL